MKSRASHSVDLLFTVSLFMVFALCAVALILSGTQVYRSAAYGLEQEFSTRTALSYVAQKLRCADAPGAVSLIQGEHGQVLEITTWAQDSEFTTYIYYDDGWLKELFLPSGREFNPDAGQQLVELSQFSIDQADSSLLEVSCAGSDGKAVSLYLSLRSEEVGGGG